MNDTIAVLNNMSDGECTAVAKQKNGSIWCAKNGQSHVSLINEVSRLFQSTNSCITNDSHSNPMILAHRANILPPMSVTSRKNVLSVADIKTTPMIIP